ncbi:bifunctional 5,10-methylenetetrahydrofolate dehydrogenase/5,10-methenyltetrahydrofolate cyclohydrolase [Amycolatopsis thailandensis]|uniref:bifunctional 5,10-methylenetetrahydrofolate dehydrogenase/5,10-methenyltetrahydrofolate cyclohydrolase n=1 Tax=Amycolatopsis thailandensis TaxID=589330 RepID=UPI00363C0BB4
MTAHFIDGRARAAALKNDLIADVERSAGQGTGVGLATVLVGDDYGSAAYERRLRKLAAEVGVPYTHRRFGTDISQAELVAAIEALNASDDISGILLLRPLPAQIDEAVIFRTIDPMKDVEAVHPENAGLLALGVPRFVPSTAASVFHLLDSYLDEAGEDRDDFYHRSLIVVVGRSNNVGKPAISLGYERQATVQSVDKWADLTTGIGRHTRWADVLIVAAGKAGLVKAEHVSENAIVIDVGINPSVKPDGGIRMVGDVDQASVAPRVRALTPVPGGVGPVTDVWLLRNTVLAARLRAGHTLYPAHHESVLETS